MTDDAPTLIRCRDCTATWHGPFAEAHAAFVEHRLRNHPPEALTSPRKRTKRRPDRNHNLFTVSPKSLDENVANARLAGLNQPEHT